MNPVTKKTKNISLIWVVPIVAAIICASLFYKSYTNSGITIQLFLETATGITAGKTRVMVRGIPVGTVQTIRPDLQNNRIGSYIDVQPGSSETACRIFTAAAQQPPPPENSPGLHLTIIAKELGSLQAGSGIYYKNIQIGEIEQTRLLPEQDKVELQTLIQPAYAELVRQGSRFYNASGIQLAGNISNISLKIASLAALLRGGIELFTPKELATTPLANSGASYPLYKDFTAAEYGLPLTLHLNSSHGIIEGATKLIYQGLVAGVVKKVEIGDTSGVTAHVQLDPRAEEILRENTRFWQVNPEISPAGVQNLKLFITGSYITFEPGDGEFRNDFEILTTPPAQLPQRPGKLFHLHNKGEAAVAKGSPVHFKGINIGEVVDVYLDAPKSGKNGGNRKVTTDIFIYQDYIHLINSKSLFWLESGVEMTASLTAGVSVKTSPIASMLFGGIAVSSPVKAKPPGKDQTFALYADYNSKKKAEEALRYFPITIKMADANDIKKGASISYKGIPIGEVERVRFAEDMQTVFAHAKIEKKARNLFRAETIIWAQQPQLGIDGIKHAKAFVLGANLAIFPGGGVLRNNFTLAAEPPHARIANKDGMGIVLETTHRGSITQGSPLYYRQVQVGEVTGYRLSPSLQKVYIFVSIKSHFRHLIRKNTHFWNASGIEISGGIFSGVTLSAESLTTIASGGIALATPNIDKEKQLSPPAKAGQHFPLYEKPEKDWLDWQPDIKIFEKEDAAAYLR